MTKNEPPPLDEPGLAGGPGPTPPGVDDRTPKPNSGPGAGPGAVPHDPAAQKEAGEVAERSAGTRDADIRESQRSDPEEPDPA
jgi:hypothetical protein